MCVCRRVVPALCVPRARGGVRLRRARRADGGAPALSVSKDHWSVEIKRVAQNGLLFTRKRIAAQRVCRGHEARRWDSTRMRGKRTNQYYARIGPAVHVILFISSVKLSRPLFSTNAHPDAPANAPGPVRNHPLFADGRMPRVPGRTIALIAMGPPAVAGFQRGFG